MHLKKWFFGTVATVCILTLSFFGTSASAAGTVLKSAAGAQTVHTHCICGGKMDIGDHNLHTDVTYTAWNGGDFDYDGGNTGVACLFLSEDVTTDASSCNRVTSSGIIEIGSEQTLYLCLNGHALRNGKTDNNVIDVYGKLILCDCTGGGTIGGRESGANSGAVWLENGTLDFFGGSLTGSKGLKNGGGIYAKGSSVIRMYGGAIIGNEVARQGGGVFLSESSSFEMFDGIISDNSATDWGGGIVADGGTSFVMHGGVIENNVSSRAGGGAFVGGTFTMNGGIVRNNKAGNGGGFIVTKDSTRGTLILNEGVIEGNYAFGNGGGVLFFQYGEMSLHEGKPITIANNTGSNLCFADKCALTLEGLTEGSSIGISHYAKPQKNIPITLYDGVTEEMSRCFFSDAADSIIRYDAGKLQLTADFYTATIRFETGYDTTLPNLRATGLTETITATIPVFSPDIACRRFLGWADSEGAATAQYTEGDTLSLTNDITLYAVWENLPHSLSETAEVAATCDSDGTKAHFTCNLCGRIFIDTPDGTKTEVTSDEQLILPGGHRFGAWQDEISASIGKSGSVAHKDCELCHKHFDVDGNEIADIIIPALPAEEPPADKENKTLPTGAIVGITAGAVVVAEAALLILFRVVFKKKKLAQLIGFFKS